MPTGRERRVVRLVGRLDIPFPPLLALPPIVAVAIGTRHRVGDVLGMELSPIAARCGAIRRGGLKRRCRAHTAMDSVRRHPI